jgi:hypothetical protein
VELKAIEQFIGTNIAPSAPKEEGLYLYISVEFDDNYPNVSLVEVRKYRKTLIADSDSWETYLPVSHLHHYRDGIWTNKLNFCSCPSKKEI